MNNAGSGDESGLPGAGTPPMTSPPLTAGARRPGLPWESPTEGRSPGAGIRTVGLVLFNPSAAFRAMRVDGSLADPLLFVLLFGTVGAVFGMLWQSLMRSWLAQMAGDSFSEIAFANSFGLISLVMAPLFVLLLVAVSAAIYHLAMLVFGGAPRPFDVTLRVVCYSWGATYLLMLVPLCGGPIATLWAVPTAIIGLREAHEVPLGRAAAAVLVPLLLVFFCCAVVWSLAIGLTMAVAGSGL
jgi:hypothetical protein